MEMDEPLNVLGEPLQPCSVTPVTGYFRDGSCNTCQQDTGLHTVCVKTTQEFLTYSKAHGNDLITPIPEYGFSGLQPGDNWCLCASRWLQAHEAGLAPKVYLLSTHIKSLEIIPFEMLREYAADLN